MILSKFPKNCMKLRKFWTGEGGPGAPSSDPPLAELSGRPVSASPSISTILIVDS